MSEPDNVERSLRARSLEAVETRRGRNGSSDVVDEPTLNRREQQDDDTTGSSFDSAVTDRVSSP